MESRPTNRKASGERKQPTSYGSLFAKPLYLGAYGRSRQRLKTKLATWRLATLTTGDLYGQCRDRSPKLKLLPHIRIRPRGLAPASSGAGRHAWCGSRFALLSQIEGPRCYPLSPLEIDVLTSFYADAGLCILTVQLAWNLHIQIRSFTFYPTRLSDRALTFFLHNSPDRRMWVKSYISDRHNASNQKSPVRLPGMEVEGLRGGAGGRAPCGVRRGVAPFYLFSRISVYAKTGEEVRDGHV